ncbi:MAG: tRNA (adenosine(37)-N6)-threonylcarbamoyltransferase complex transferase subunit TsaD [Patescibacteria group bacterium]
MKILAIETSCDETCAAVTEGTNILSSVVYSQIDLHKEFGGVVPSIARRAHEEKISFVIDKAMLNAQCSMLNIDAVAVTAGPGLSIALEVGIRHAKEWAKKLNKSLIAVNHIEGHVLSGLTPEVQFPALALVVSGGHTELIWVEKIGQYRIVARTMDDALGEALDKAARMLGLGYPGGAELEKKAVLGNSKAYPLPLPMARSKILAFSYSGLKTAFYRLVKDQNINDLAACFQNRAFEHLLRVTRATLNAQPTAPKDLLVGGGVVANAKLREEIKKLSDEVGCRVWFPGKGMYGDNAAMIGIAANFKAQRGEFSDPEKVDRLPRWRIDERAF